MVRPTTRARKEVSAETEGHKLEALACDVSFHNFSIDLFLAQTAPPIIVPEYYYSEITTGGEIFVSPSHSWNSRLVNQVLRTLIGQDTNSPGDVANNSTLGWTAIAQLNAC